MPSPDLKARFTTDCRKQPWLSLLLEAYTRSDAAVARAVAGAEAGGRRLACRAGCSACCRSHGDIPVYPLELVGIAWYVTEQVRGAARAALKARLRAHRPGAPCPFLVEDRCSIHPLRPMACRHFNVLDRPCAPGEDAWHTRPQDVVSPAPAERDAALAVTLPFYGVAPGAGARLLREGALNAVARNLNDCQWTSLAERMEAYDRRARETEVQAPVD